MASWPYNTQAWQRLRKAKLANDPLCYPCGLRGRLVSANTVDHIEAISDGGEPFPSFDGLMSMCARCHNEKTNAVDRPDRQPTGRRFKGFDVDGNPIDPDDAWRGGANNHQNRSVIGPARKSRTYLVFENDLQKGLKSWD